jgi:hypothetical protein
MLFNAASATAQAPRKPGPPNLAAAISGNPADALAGSIRGYLVQWIPSPLYEAHPDWGRTAHSLGKKRKQGLWRKMHVTALNPADTLVFDIRDINRVDSERLKFTAFLSLEVRAEQTWQRWVAGVKLWDTSVRVRFRVRISLQCEATLRFEAGPLLVPDAEFRLHVIQSHVGFDQMVVEHIAGLGGEAAELIGDAIRGGLRQWRPSLERDLLAKAAAAITKSAETREVRFRLRQLWQKSRGVRELSVPAS